MGTYIGKRLKKGGSMREKENLKKIREEIRSSEASIRKIAEGYGEADFTATRERWLNLTDIGNLASRMMRRR